MDSTASGTGSMTVCSSADIPLLDPVTLERHTTNVGSSHRNMAPSWSSYRWYSLPRTDGYQRCHLPCPPLPDPPRRHSQHLRASCTCVLRPYGVRYLPPDQRDGRFAVCRSPRCSLHGYHARLHFAFGRRKLRQRGYCHLLVGLHLFLVDQGGEERFHVLGCVDRALLRVHGVGVGWLCVHYEFATAARLRSDLHGKIQPQTLR